MFGVKTVLVVLFVVMAHMVCAQGYEFKKRKLVLALTSVLSPSDVTDFGDAVVPGC